MQKKARMIPISEPVMGKEEIENVCDCLKSNMISFLGEYVKIFEEMVERKSEEAKILWQIDKLEMTIQALEYEKEQNKNLDEFFVNALLQIETPLLKKILNEVLKKRSRLKKSIHK